MAEKILYVRRQAVLKVCLQSIWLLRWENEHYLHWLLPEIYTEQLIYEFVESNT